MISAKLTCRPRHSQTTLLVTGEDGSLTTITSAGVVEELSFIDGWRATRAIWSSGGTIWVSAIGFGSNSLWRADQNGGWHCVLTTGEPILLAGAVRNEATVSLSNQVVAVDFKGTCMPVVPTPADLKDMCVSTTGDFWAVAGKSAYGGYGVQRFSLIEQRWMSLPPPARAVRISAASDGTAWSVNSRGELWRLHPLGAGNFKECSQTTSCRNCLYSPQSLNVRLVSDDGSGGLWFASEAPNLAQEIGYFANLGTRRVKRFASPISPVFLSAFSS